VLREGLCWQIGTYFSTLAPKTVAADMAFGLASYALLVHITFLPVFGMLADRVGRHVVMGVGALGLFVAPPFAFLMFSQGSVALNLVGCSILSLFLSMYGGPLFSWIIHNTTAKSSYTAVGLAYNLGKLRV
jgi:MFS family permease